MNYTEFIQTKRHKNNDFGIDPIDIPDQRDSKNNQTR